MTREAIVDYITKMPGNHLTEMGPVPESYGNFYVDVMGSLPTPVARLVFFDSRIDHVNVSINDTQLVWFNNLTKSLPAVPTLAFYHIPIQEYVDATLIHKISGHHREKISTFGKNTNIFPSFKAGGVVAGFCGHDHTNDFCVEWQGIELCYEGSPGFTAYG
jgi:hypothetical protein